ncbi:PREDICTED: protein FAR-RED IMPAIRED RESPONSE 1-like [Ipomoea nil]|uniref:protein FAR-RED IMPAIRED RESPONSE 1-like n=1 Tax=Ipomoea nil TaxID=35883 RepID=UPI0009011850|nr:PREDICTED: protein FAR-RED IMPAIRED RESPONSE 1-like [Ipomoea nil]
MTDQCAAMAAAISIVFPTSRHRLCIWHIDTEAEFEFYWTRMVIDFKCHKNTWLGKLYDCREKWCPAFNKDYFSGGILSSQRSETTNHSISRRLSKTAGLCDFYSSFVSVISEWRSKENGEDFRCAQGVPAMLIDNVKLLSHAREVYTIEIYFLFEEQLMKGSACHQEVVFNDGCKLFSEMGILCCHCIRILDINCVASIPDKYIMKRWTKKVAAVRNANFDSLFYNVGIPPSIWVVEISKKFQKLVVSSQDNSVARQFCDEAVENAKKLIEAENGKMNTEGCGDSSSNGIVQDPSSRRLKGVPNKRMSSIIAKKYTIARGRRSAANKVASNLKGPVQSLVLENISEIAGDGYLVHPTSSSSQFVRFNKSLGENVVAE